MIVAPVLAERSSSSWADAAARSTVVVATHDRAQWLPELLAALDQDAGGHEVVIADDGSTDGTWALLERWAAATALPALVLRLAATGGPSIPRNTAVSRARGAVLLLTDDDCLPQPGWVALMAAAGAGAVAQGLTCPSGERSGPWDRTISIAGLTGLWETCNLAMPRSAFLAAGGFPVRSLLSGPSRGFGEDVLLGAAVARALPSRFVDAAVVLHRWVPADYREHLAGRWRLRGFAPLLAEVPDLRDAMWHRWFLTRRTATVDAGLVGLLGRRPALVLPWCAFALQDARRLPGPPAKRFAQVIVADLVAAAALAVGSGRARRLLL